MNSRLFVGLTSTFAAGCFCWAAFDILENAAKPQNNAIKEEQIVTTLSQNTSPFIGAAKGGVGLLMLFYATLVVDNERMIRQAKEKHEHRLKEARDDYKVQQAINSMALSSLEPNP